MAHRMPHSRIDHLVITAPTLEMGCAAVSAAIGVPMDPGGKHERMGTHNCLLRLGDMVYLEVIAIDTGSAVPSHPRWFELDPPSASTAPRLAAWVARTDDIHSLANAMPDMWGRVLSMQRNNLNWLITVPKNGRIPYDGMVPMLIQWKGDRHPTQSLPDRGCALVRLEGFHPEPDRIHDLLQASGTTDEIVVSISRRDEPPRLVAHIQTPNGLRLLELPGAHRG